MTRKEKASRRNWLKARVMGALHLMKYSDEFITKSEEKEFKNMSEQLETILNNWDEESIIYSNTKNRK